jgi:tRNA dimethylallyltransferase
VGYRELFSYFDREISLEFAIEEIKKNTRRFSKRQLTWFKRNENTKWLDFETPYETVVAYINSKK